MHVHFLRGWVLRFCSAPWGPRPNTDGERTLPSFTSWKVRRSQVFGPPPKLGPQPDNFGLGPPLVEGNARWIYI